jgi:hypothetical protein
MTITTIQRMKLTLLLGGFVIVSILAACSDEEAANPPIGMSSEALQSDPEDLIRGSLATMAELESYRQEFTFRPEGEPIVFLVDYLAPSDYYERLLETPDFAGAVELILVGDKLYTRSCDAYPDDCEGWEQHERQHQAPPSAGGLTTSFPETLGLVAVELAEGARVIANEETEGTDLIRIRGSLNLSRTVYENQKRVLEHGGTLEDCDVEGSSEYRDGMTIEATPARTCRPISIEEALAEQFESTDFDAVPLSTIDVWVSLDDLRLDQIVIGTPGKAVADEEAISEEDTFFETSFSHFDEVSVTAPE